MPRINELLEVSLDSGLSEWDFWNMTLAEIVRHLESYARREKERLREKAMFIYRLADLIGISNGRYYSKEFIYPEIFDVFEGLFDAEEVLSKRQEERDRKSIEKLRAMAQLNE